MLKPDTQTCPACSSPNLWTDEDNGKTYKLATPVVFVGMSSQNESQLTGVQTKGERSERDAPEITGSKIYAFRQLKRSSKEKAVSHVELTTLWSMLK